MPDWTKEQEQVIASRGQNLLVAAAAGSGKTAVLVERIIRMLTEPESKLDIDRLLVVTYTNAAAAEMKDKILRALEGALSLRPDDHHLAAQLTRIHSANISTIHSFCLSVIRSHFQDIDLDPSFRTGDDGEMQLLKKEVVQELVDECYENLANGIHPSWLGEDTDLEYCLRSVETGRSDDKLETMILEVHDHAVSYESEEGWLKKCRKICASDGENNFLQKLLKETAVKKIGECLDTLLYLEQINAEQNGPQKYAEPLHLGAEVLKELQQNVQTAEMEEIRALLQETSLPGLPRVQKKEGWDEAIKKLVSDKLKEVVSDIKKLLADYFYGSPDEVEENEKRGCNTIRVLVDLTIEFRHRFQAAKQKRNLIDYSDMEHYALDILTREEDGIRVPSPAAMEYRDHFAEVIIDEYQDSSFIQEAILSSVSGIPIGRNNRFMVGDVKQSIYGFRQSRPEIFQEKYVKYHKEEETGSERINLTRNFRSDARILDCVNDIFRRIMRKEVGGVDYTKEQELVYGRGSFMPARQEMPPTEVLILNKSAKEETDEGDKELEFAMIAQKIREIVQNPEELIHDAHTGELRQIRYGDIVILLRSMKNRAETGVNVLMQYGIPAYTESRSGYFDAREIRAILDYLRVLDNPRQDICMASVLHSPMGGFTSDDLAAIRIAGPDMPFSMAVLQYAKERGEDETDQVRREKLRSFMDMVQRHRDMVQYTPLHQLLRRILKDTGYGAYLMAMPGHARREANVEILIRKAHAYEETSYKGIFHFLRYLDELKDKDVDFGEANIAAEGDSVRIMSSHKSKGLEFPVVFVSGLGTSLRRGSVQNPVLHPTLGMAVDSVDLARRIKNPTISKKLILKELDHENIGEEIRILYVAMTRARERMFLTGAASKPEEKYIAWQNVRWEGTRMATDAIMRASTSLDLIMPAVLKELQDFETLIVDSSDIADADVEAAVHELLTEEMIRELDTEAVYDEELLKQLQIEETRVYPYEKTLKYPLKVSVSEIKMQRMEEANDGMPVFEEKDPVPLLPKFLQEEEGPGGAFRGTSYHRFLELYDYTAQKEDTVQESDVRDAIRVQKESGLLPEEMAELIRPRAMVLFLNSTIGQRMRKASLKGLLKREQMFMLGLPGKEVHGEDAGDETYLVQGIIDACFEEEGELVLVDYKTDRVEEEAELRKRYASQLELYAKALERLTGKPVKEKLMYSFALRRTVDV